MADNNFSLLNMDGLSDVCIKMLDMIEKAIGWTITPKGSRKDLEDALQYYKKTIMDDKTIPPIVKASRIASAKKELTQYVNQGKIINNAGLALKETATFKNVDLDWLSYFFDYAKNIQDENIQKIWARLLAEQCNGDTSIRRNLIHILSLMDAETAVAFTNLCRLVIKVPIHNVSKALATRYIPEYVPVISPFLVYSLYLALPDDSEEKQAMLNYRSCIPNPEQLATFKELGLINFRENQNEEFSYPYRDCLTHHRFEKVESVEKRHKLVETTRHDYIINYFSNVCCIAPDKSKHAKDPEYIKLGLVQFTSTGVALYKAIKVDEVDGFLFFLTKYLELQGLNVNIQQTKDAEVHSLR